MQCSRWDFFHCLMISAVSLIWQVETWTVPRPVEFQDLSSLEFSSDSWLVFIECHHGLKGPFWRFLSSFSVRLHLLCYSALHVFVSLNSNLFLFNSARLLVSVWSASLLWRLRIVSTQWNGTVIVPTLLLSLSQRWQSFTACCSKSKGVDPYILTGFSSRF